MKAPRALTLAEVYRIEKKVGHTFTSGNAVPEIIETIIRKLNG